MIHLSRLIAVLCCLGLFMSSACQSSSDQVLTQPSTSFFDLSDYFDEEQADLALVRQVKKKVQINDRTEEQVIDSIDFKEELSIFIDADINRVAWLDKYQVDSTINDAGQLTQIAYQALEEQLKTRELIIRFANDAVEEISIHKMSNSAVVESDQQLVYLSGKGYTIRARQKMGFSDEQRFSVDAEFIR